MKITKLTKLFIVGITLFIIAYDVFAYLYGHDSTISQVIYSWSIKFPLLPLAVGVLMGHFFWPNSRANEDE